VAGAIPAAAAAEGRGSETILLVEDDPMLRRLAESTLKRAGYQVLTAADAAEGLRLAREHEGPIHAVVTDVVMPGLPGPDLVARLEQARPGVRALYMSGYTEHPLLQDGITEDGVSFLPKPFGPDELARRVRQLLDAGR
jgi:DNA-binding NtrC family response regulator